MHRKRITSSKIIAITDYGYQRRECSIAVIESVVSAGSISGANTLR